MKYFFFKNRKDAFFLCQPNLEAICTKLKLTFPLMPPKVLQKVKKLSFPNLLRLESLLLHELEKKMQITKCSFQLKLKIVKVGFKYNSINVMIGNF